MKTHERGSTPPSLPSLPPSLPSPLHQEGVVHWLLDSHAAGVVEFLLDQDEVCLVGSVLGHVDWRERGREGGKEGGRE